MSATAYIGGHSRVVDASAEVFLDEQNNPVAVSEDNPLPVSFTANGFTIPPHNDVEIAYSLTAFPSKPTYMTFRLNGTAVFWLMFTYDAAGNLTRIQPD
jgi:hypothetical protein